MAESGAHPRRAWRSAAAVLLGLVTVVGLTLGTDHVLDVLEVYPPGGSRCAIPA